MKSDVKDTVKYILKRILLMIFTFAVIFIMCFILIRLLPSDKETGQGDDQKWMLVQEALGRKYRDETGEFHDVPVISQFFTFLKNLFKPSQIEVEPGRWESVSKWGYSWEISRMAKPNEYLFSHMAPTLLINIYSMLFSVPIGMLLGIYMALKKNKWQDNTLSVLVMLLISVPNFVISFLLQYLFGYKWGILPPEVYAVGEEINGSEVMSWLEPRVFVSMILPVLSMSFGSIAGYARYTRAELTEVLTSDFMLLARTKGLSRKQATVRHALRNSLVPIFPMLLGEILSLLSGSMIIENIFGIPGVGSVMLESILKKDYDMFQFCSMFYIFIGLVGGLIVDISYSLVDPRIRMGGGKQNY